MDPSEPLIVEEPVDPTMVQTSRLGSTFTPASALAAHVWTNLTSRTFRYPELQLAGQWGIPRLIASPDVGIALGGGGLRAAAFADGWVRGLFMLNATQRVRYLSANSGGAWYASAFSYSSQATASFVGKYVAPEALSLWAARAGAGPGTFLDALSRANLASLLALNPLEANNPMGTWTELISRLFLAPFGLAAAGSTITHVGTWGRVHARLPGRAPIPAYQAGTQERPYPIIVTALGPLGNRSRDWFWPFEFTPLYSGVPTQGYDTAFGAVGGFVETLGFNAPAPAVTQRFSSPDGSQTLAVKPTWVVPLASMVSVSSSAFTTMFAWATPEGSSLAHAVLGQQFYNTFNTVNFTGGLAKFTDGAAADNQAIMPLLRRGVRSIILCQPTQFAITADTTAAGYARTASDVAMLFGAAPVDTPLWGWFPAATAQQHSQVFSASEWPAFFAALKAAVLGGGAAVVQGNYQVLPNAYHNVRGGYRVNVLWLVVQQSTAWEAKLPADARGYLCTLRANTSPLNWLQGAPNVQTVIPSLTPELATLMSQQGTWMALQAQGAVNRLLDGGSFPTGSTALGTMAQRGGLRALPAVMRWAFGGGAGVRNTSASPATLGRR